MGTTPIGALDGRSYAYRNINAADNASQLLGTSVDGANDAGKLWIPIWSGEVLHAYDEYRMFEPLVTSKMIDSGREELFPITGTVELKAAWGAGEYLVGGEDATSSQFSVTLDKRPMAAHFELDNVDLMITQWEYRQELARQAGQTLANARDKQIARYLVFAGAVGKITGDPRTGLSLPAPGSIAAHTPGAAYTAAQALELLEAIDDYVVDLQENDVPVGATFCAVSPRLFQAIRRLGVAESTASTGAVNMQPMFGGVAAAGGLGAQFTQGLNSLSDSLTYMGVTIVKSNHVPQENDAAANGVCAVGEARYGGAFATAGVQAIMWQPDAVAALRKTGLVVDTESDIRRNSTFTVASMMNGTGVLRPELVKVVTDVPATTTRAALITALSTTAATIGYEKHV